MTFVPGGDNENKSREETSLENAEEDTGDAELTPCFHKTHTKLSGAPTNDANCEPRPCPQRPEGYVSGQLPKVYVSFGGKAM